MSFRNAVVVITGASSGIGRAAARRFASEGARVVLASRDAAALEAVAGEVRAAGGEAVVCVMDVTIDAGVARLAEMTRAAFGPADVVVANAGYGMIGPLTTVPMDDLRAIFDTNVLGVVRTVQAFAGDVRATRGRFVLVGSVLAHMPTPYMAAYASTKFAVRALAHALDGELARDGVSVTLVNPGSTRTKFAERSVLGEGADRDSIGKYRRYGASADRVARALVRGARWRRREVLVPWTSRFALILQAIAPRLVGHIMARAIGGSKE